MELKLRPKFKSLCVSVPIFEKLKNHLSIVQQREFEEIKEKVSKKNSKQEKINEIQKQFAEWVVKKKAEIQQKMEKSTKLKKENLDKVVNKCKFRQKHVGQKMKTFYTQKRLSLKQAWKKTQQFSQFFADQNTNFISSKRFSRRRFSTKLKTDQNLNQSKVLITFKKDQLNNFSINEVRNKNQTKKSLKGLKKHDKTYFEQQVNCYLEKDQNLASKLQQNQNRFKQLTYEIEKGYIQKFGEKLQKIQKSRVKMPQRRCEGKN